jgi:hypothetical protein
MALDLCVVSGIVYDVNGAPAVGVGVYIARVEKSGIVIEAHQRLAATSDADGEIEFTVARDSTAWISGRFRIGGTNFDTETAVAIPDAATADLEDLGTAVDPPVLLDPDDTLAADSDTRIATQRATKAYVDAQGVGGSAWGGISGSIAAQADLDAALALKAPIASPTFTGTVSGVTKSHVGLGSVDNTADSAKPISTATQTALDAKAAINATTGVIPYKSGASALSDSPLAREDANTVGQYNGSTIQKLCVYNTRTSSVNFERVAIFSEGTGNATFVITNENGGSGGTSGQLSLRGTTYLTFYTAGGQRAYFDTANLNLQGVGIKFTDNAQDIGASGATRPRTGYFGTKLVAPTHEHTAMAFGSLPASPVEGMVCAITDSNTATWGATAAGGGANHVLVWYNGTAWKVIGA